MLNTSQLARITLVMFLLVGGFLVLEPFMTAILFAIIICVSTWPTYQWIWNKTQHRDTVAALLMTVLLLVALIVPMAYLAANLTDSASALLEQLRPRLENPQPYAPDWLRKLPLIGEPVSDFWQRMAVSHEEFMEWLSQFQEPARDLAFRAARQIGGGLLQLVMVVVIAFFLYRDGKRLANGIVLIAHKLGGELGDKMLDLSCGTVKAVMLGIFGTAVAQALVAWLGFIIVGAPAPLLLATATFFLSMIPIGPPLVWAGVSLWLFNGGYYAWGVFMAIYGLVAISGVDNVIKPILISHSAKLPLLLIILGVLGGAVAFGVVGIFIGPTLLALGLKLLQHWIASQYQETGNKL